MKIEENNARIIIEGVTPQVDDGRFPAKAVVGDTVTVEADIYADGHDTLAARLLYRRQEQNKWTESPMKPLVNDRWRGSFTADKTGNYVFNIAARVDRFQSWLSDFKKRVEAGQPDLEVYLQTAAGLIAEAGRRASGADGQKMAKWANMLKSEATTTQKIKLATGVEVSRLMDRYANRRRAVTFDRELVVAVDRAKAGFGAWYEMFPRSASATPGQHGTFRDCEDRLPYIAGMGFDVLYIPPIHPIGRTCRKGKNNSVNCDANDPGTPWAIGGKEGGHKAIHPRLGTLEDFRHLMDTAGKYGMEIALDIAFQCSPDHPYVKEHPEWFLWRPDGTVQYAENPPKKYQDIYPFNFGTERPKELWEELKSIVTYWAQQGVRIFRVDNPHTKPFPFWEWLISGVKREYPDAIFLSEAFTRPKVMYHLAKLGFTQSYTYFTWRNGKRDLTEYLTELTQTGVRDFFRPNFWTNTPDILHAYLQAGGRAAFMARLVLAATPTSRYGIYGPAYELMESTPREPGSEEYLNSEKYELKHWDIDRPDSLREFITRVNRIRRENPALQHNRNLWFNVTDNEQLLCYSKHTDDLSSLIMVVVNLDPHRTQSGVVNVPIEPWGFDTEKPYQLDDLLADTRYTWRGSWNYVELNPAVSPAHIFHIVNLAPAPPR